MDAVNGPTAGVPDPIEEELQKSTPERVLDGRIIVNMPRSVDPLD